MRKISAWSLLICLAGLAIWDIIPATNDQPGDTISEVVRDWSQTIYLLPYITGIVMGHFFINKTRDTYNLKVLWVTGIAVAIRDLLNLGTFAGGNTAYFVVGVLFGHIFWPQERSNGNSEE